MLTFHEYPDGEALKKAFDDLHMIEFEKSVDQLGIHPLKDENGVQLLIEADDGTYPVSRGAESYLRYHTGLNPRSYGEYADDLELLGKMVQHCLKKRHSTLRFQVANGMVTAIHSADAPSIGPRKLIDIMLDLGEQVRLEKFGLDEKTGELEWRLLTAKASVPPKRVGEPSHVGLHITSNGYVQIAPYVVTLSCVNGLLGTHMYPKAVRTSEVLATKLKDLMVDCISKSADMLEHLMASDNVAVSNPAGYLAGVAKSYGLSSKLTTELIGKLASLPDNPTAYDITQLITAEANTLGIRKLQNFGWHVQQSITAHRCMHCAQPLD